MKRRTALAWTVGATAVLAGALGAQWRRHRAAAPEDNVWGWRFETPAGGAIDLAAWKGRPTLLNFWATWCPPCVRELPLLDRFQHDQAAGGWQVIALAVDNREPVLEFLRHQPVSLPVGLAGAAGVGLSRQLGNTAGSLPFTVVFDSTGRLVQRRLGVIEPDDLRAWTAHVH